MSSHVCTSARRPLLSTARIMIFILLASTSSDLELSALGKAIPQGQ
jgi:hypothetical protein